MSHRNKHVKVVIRTRPTSEYAQNIINFSEDGKSVNIHVPKNAEGGYINNQQEDWDFQYDNILHNVSQEAVYEECVRDILKNVLEGYNGTILAYGQTGAGKTFTMTGATENYKHRGLIPRAIAQMFREISDRPQYSYTIRISYIEIYNEQMIDLLGNLPDCLKGENLHVIEDKNGSASVKGLAVKIANSEEEALSYLFEGETVRSIAEHQLNRNSSRSHCIFTMYVESRSRLESSEKVLYSKLNLVDLAGSERLSKTQTTGVMLREAMYINKSLTFLEQVIIALADKRRGHIPYRQSKLTNVLRDALGGNCNTLMIANIRCERDYIEETISTLRFATRMMCVTTTPEINVQYDPLALIKKYEREIKELKQELSMHDTLANRSHVHHEPFTDAQKLELQRQVKAYLQNEEEELEVVSLRQIKELFSQFRTLYKAQERETEDWQRIHRSQLKLQPSATREEAVDTHAVMSKADKDDGVGELEGTGFGVGLAPSGGRAGGMAGARAGNKDKRRKSRIPSTTLPPAQSLTSLVQASTTNEAEELLREPALEADQPILSSQKPSDHAIAPEQANLHALPPLPKPRALAPSSRADEFEAFKRGKGSEMNRILIENKGILKEKKRQAKELAEQVNEVKRQIDVHKTKIEGKRQTRSTTVAAGSGEDVIIDEEEYILLSALKELRQQYRDYYDQLGSMRSDIDYCSRLVDQCRQKLMTEFEQWYEQRYGGQIADEGEDGQIEDLMDIGEKFDKLQMERMSQEDPDSVAFYTAKKNSERKLTKGQRVRKH
ncbi:Kinesin-like protein kif9 [Gaertneriomyces sp. JEL0708]|nr:Kinesin-like protein kif9 [Gaertneriomyces sp. JEL0708]